MKETVTNEGLYNEVLSILDKDYTGNRVTALSGIMSRSAQGEFELTDEQCDTIEQELAESINWEGNYDNIVVYVPAILSNCKGQYRLDRFDTVIESLGNESYPEDSPMRWFNNLRFDYLKRAGVVDQDELPYYAEFAYVSFGNPLGIRISRCYLTDRRMVLVGPFDAAKVGNSTVYRLHYPGMLERPYHALVDYIDYSRMSELKNKWSLTGKYISFKYNTSYIQEKARVLYGPYFFKMDLSSSSKVKQGQLQINISPVPVSRPVEDEGAFRKRRQETLYERLSKFTK
ncbi:MAG: hypothetical protein P1Q69_20195 [Candidatus Thorarchaeota archaeon]|nr:hypothetical protein [Candidatus Thorarchaeota archaeon]